jgi:molecular chaperone DnaJ
VFGGPNGSLFVVLDVKPHQFFKRRDNDILLNLDINVAQAVLGADIHVPTIDGDEKLRIPAGTQPGKIFHLKGKGVPHVRSKHQKLAESLGTTVKPQEKGFLDWLNDAFGG